MLDFKIDRRAKAGKGKKKRGAPEIRRAVLLINVNGFSY